MVSEVMLLFPFVFGVCVRFCTKLYLYAFNQPNICRHIKMVGIRLVHPTRHSTTTTTLSANTKSTQTSGCDDYEVVSNIGNGGRGSFTLSLGIKKRVQKARKYFHFNAHSGCM